MILSGIGLILYILDTMITDNTDTGAWGVTALFLIAFNLAKISRRTA